MSHICVHSTVRCALSVSATLTGLEVNIIEVTFHSEIVPVFYRDAVANKSSSYPLQRGEDPAYIIPSRTLAQRVGISASRRFGRFNPHSLPFARSLATAVVYHGLISYVLPWPISSGESLSDGDYAMMTTGGEDDQRSENRRPFCSRNFVVLTSISRQTDAAE